MNVPGVIQAVMLIEMPAKQRVKSQTGGLCVRRVVTAIDVRTQKLHGQRVSGGLQSRAELIIGAALDGTCTTQAKRGEHISTAAERNRAERKRLASVVRVVAQTWHGGGDDSQRKAVDRRGDVQTVLQVVLNPVVEGLRWRNERTSTMKMLRCGLNKAAANLAQLGLHTTQI
jgi:hypothetical protein